MHLLRTRYARVVRAFTAEQTFETRKSEDLQAMAYIRTRCTESECFHGKTGRDGIAPSRLFLLQGTHEV